MPSPSQSAICTRRRPWPGTRSTEGDSTTHDAHLTRLTMKASHALFSIASFMIVAALGWAQAPNLEPRTPADRQAPIVSFEFVLDGAQPPHYSLSVEPSGRAAYRSDDALDKGGEAGQPYMVKFLVSTANAEKIFELAKSLNY